METNKAGVPDPVIRLNTKSKTIAGTFNITHEREDEIEVAMRRVLRNLRDEKSDFNNGTLIEQFTKIATTPEELGFVCYHAGSKAEEMSNLQQSVLDGLVGGDGFLGNLLKGKGRSNVRMHTTDDPTEILSIISKILKNERNKS